MINKNFIRCLLSSILLLSAAVLNCDELITPQIVHYFGIIIPYFLFAISLVLLIYLILQRKKYIEQAVASLYAKHEKELNEHKLLLQELEFNRNQLKLIFEFSPIGIAMRDINGKLIDINQAYADILGYCLKELKAGSFDHVAYDPDIQKSENAYQKLINGEKSVKLEKRLKKSDGSLIHVIQHLVLIRDADQNPVFLVGMTVDITEKVNAYNLLEESELFYQDVLANMSGLVYKCANDKEWTMFYLNHQIESISGYPASDFINNKIRSFASIIHPEDIEALEEAVQTAINNHSPFIKEYRIIHKNGSIVWVYEEGRGIFDEMGKLLYISGTIIDFTKRKDDERKLQEYGSHLEEMVRERTREIKEQYKELEKVHRLFIGRELRIKELRDKIKSLNWELENHKKHP